MVDIPNVILIISFSQGDRQSDQEDTNSTVFKTEIFPNQPSS